MAYKKCPRCCLNYIDEKETYCQICLAELGKIKGDNTLDLADEDYELCPECGENMISANEEMCSQCAMLRAVLSHQKAEDDSAQADTWEEDTYGEEIPIDDSKPEGIELVDLDELEDEESLDEEDDDDEENRNDYDFDDEPIDFDEEDEDDEDDDF